MLVPQEYVLVPQEHIIEPEAYMLVPEEYVLVPRGYSLVPLPPANIMPFIYFTSSSNSASSSFLESLISNF